jgi:hypothetical protein
MSKMNTGSDIKADLLQKRLKLSLIPTPWAPMKTKLSKVLTLNQEGNGGFQP